MRSGCPLARVWSNEATQMKHGNEAMQMKQRKTGTRVPVLFSPRHGSIDNWHYLQQLEGEDRIQLKPCSHHRLQMKKQNN